mmetsp:Transcript_5740/g.20475  ORF Transcript_5740/g.20475 Transcript_5740/m.20475 type:complete len:138 (-) Transcript_5740:1937-2350(-)
MGLDVLKGLSSDVQKRLFDARRVTAHGGVPACGSGAVVVSIPLCGALRRSRSAAPTSAPAPRARESSAWSTSGSTGSIGFLSSPTTSRSRLTAESLWCARAASRGPPTRAQASKWVLRTDRKHHRHAARRRRFGVLL